MAVSQDSKAPYATIASILDILERFRSRGLPKPINKDVLSRSGVSTSLIPRTLQSLQILDLIDKEGNPTETFEGFRLAPEQEYKTCLAEWLKGAYADVFSFVDPTKDSEVAIRDAFRSYMPISQQDRMVSLFTGLCVAAGLRKGVQKETKVKKVSTQSNNQKINHSQQKQKQKLKNSQQEPVMPPALLGLMKSLPEENKGWTQDQHDKFLKTFNAVLVFCYPIVAQDEDDCDAEEQV